MQKDKANFKLKLLPLALLSCCVWSVSALASGYLPPRLSVDANAGGSATVGQADLMLSFDGDQQHNLYVDPQASYGTDEQWYADLGLGYRWIENDAAIVGWYVFASRTHVEKQAGFWIANPGVEAMGSRWDARVNGYIPVAGRSDEIGIVRFNQSSRLVFSGHTESLVTTYVTGDETQQVGNGVDAKVGYQVFRHVPLKAYLGGYFFNIPNADNVRGGAAGVEYWFDRNVKVFANYTYDNLQHNTVVGGLALSFGGVDAPRADPSLSERLSDPVERYLANLGHGSKIPSDTELTNLQTGRKSVLSDGSLSNLPSGGGSQIVTVDAVFFSQNGAPNNGGLGLTLANCTFENPCGPTDFSQTGVNTLNTLLPNTQMLFNGGAYPASNGSNALILNNGQSVFGVNPNYTTPAQGAARPAFNGAFILNGNNTLDSIILNNSLVASTTAISSTGGQNLAINNTVIGSTGTPYGMAMNLNGAGATLTGSTVNVATQVGIASGVVLLNSVLDVELSTINVVNNNSSPTASGILADNSSLLTINNSTLNITGLGPSTGAITGVLAQNDSDVIIDNSVINVTAVTTNLKALGLKTGLIPDNSAISIIQGNLTVSGSASSRMSEGEIYFTEVSCLLNGKVASC